MCCLSSYSCMLKGGCAVRPLNAAGSRGHGNAGKEECSTHNLRPQVCCTCLCLCSNVQSAHCVSANVDLIAEHTRTPSAVACPCGITLPSLTLESLWPIRLALILHAFILFNPYLVLVIMDESSPCPCPPPLRTLCPRVRMRSTSSMFSRQPPPPRPTPCPPWPPLPPSQPSNTAWQHSGEQTVRHTHTHTCMASHFSNPNPHQACTTPCAAVLPGWQPIHEIYTPVHPHSDHSAAPRFIPTKDRHNHQTGYMEAPLFTHTTPLTMEEPHETNACPQHPAPRTSPPSHHLPVALRPSGLRRRRRVQKRCAWPPSCWCWTTRSRATTCTATCARLWGVHQVAGARDTPESSVTPNLWRYT